MFPITLLDRFETDIEMLCEKIRNAAHDIKFYLFIILS